MNKKTVIIILAVLLLAVFALFKLHEAKNKGVLENAEVNHRFELKDDTAYLFVGATCPHCKTVEKHIEDNQLKDKLKIEILEVFKNFGNQDYYLEAQKRCGNDAGSRIEVPVLYYQGDCIDGADKIIEKLDELAKD